ncbi:unnamed protein product [Schistosoma mattheei]|uniref:Uncharacterized protein n=1 Tax=Schistosoma mattheei TaxID=31246 RepID=A0A183P102_9TREM|nr:unnamed protein product [Schistosoma mattheei]
MDINDTSFKLEVRSRKKRKPYTRYQTMVLENEFMGNAYITRQKRWEISCKLHLTERQLSDIIENGLLRELWSKETVYM